MEFGELIACLSCIFVLSYATVLAFKFSVKYQANFRVAKYAILGGWLLIADETGQGMLALSGAIRGNPAAQTTLGLHYLTGSMNGSLRKWQLWWPKNAERGQFWLDKAASTGSPLAEATMAQAYVDGDMGLPKDGRMAATYLKRVVANRKSDEDMKGQAAYNLYQLYKHGDGVPEDPSQAFSYVLMAAGSGNGEAAYLAGREYEIGQAVPQDFGKAYTYYKTAVDHGYPAALGDFARLKKTLGQK